MTTVSPSGPVASSRKKSSNMSGRTPVTPSGENPPGCEHAQPEVALLVQRELVVRHGPAGTLHHRDPTFAHGPRSHGVELRAHEPRADVVGGGLGRPREPDRAHLPAVRPDEHQRRLIGDDLQLDGELGSRLGAPDAVAEITERDHRVALVELPVGFRPAACPKTVSPVLRVNSKSVGSTVSVATGQLNSTGSPSSYSTSARAEMRAEVCRRARVAESCPGTVTEGRG